MAQESIGRGGESAPRADGPPSIIAAGLRIIGNVVSGGVIRIEGEVLGDVQCAELTIGAEGRVNGHVVASAVVVLGKLTGSIRARHVRITRGATVAGEVVHERLTVEAGARLDSYYRPVEKVDLTAAVDVRRQLGRVSQGEPQLPRRMQPPFRKRPRGATSPRETQGLTLKPFH